jgi:predicted nucleotidyltransferase component of viral defense system
MGLSDYGVVEKDYFVTLLLKKIAERQPGIIFKGGTSLSKCYKLINRFSEDLDLNVEFKGTHPTEGQRKKFSETILTIIDTLGFHLANAEQIRSRRDFNRYVIDYPSANSYAYLKQSLIIETAVYIKSYPSQEMSAACYIYDFLMAVGGEEEVKKYGLEPFQVKVQSLERSFIDKVFAVGDYYLTGKSDTYSRHIYDLYKLYPHICFDDSFKTLVRDVRKLRNPHKTCLSAQDGVNLTALLTEILDNRYYENDFKRITKDLLFDGVTYQEASGVLNKIIVDGYFT